MTKGDLEQLARAVYDGVSEAIPAAQEWIKTAIFNTIINTASKGDSYEEGFDIALGYLREVSASLGQSCVLKQDLCDSAFEKLYDLCMSQGWGALSVEIKAGIPVMVREYRRDIKLVV